ncbi:MAG: glycosyltransferase family 4 protein [Timaviella obliquedivisa GSE-PSE-MK23-08B]|jgi:glycosyltransferase involved in cell wall biosynthesis|nr:glycosyltransferase family 4 protein [Timaviella obliquedivisa GSE-PSE-MK23-08B]
MRKPVITIFYQFDPWNPTIGGIQSIVRYFLKYAPPEFALRFVGTTASSDLAIGKWHVKELEGRELLFMPLLFLENDNIKQRVPTSVRYTQALMTRQLDSDFMHFHRIEPTLVTRSWSGEKTLFVHNDIYQQMSSNDDHSAISWRRFPQAYFFLEQSLVKQFDQIMSCNSDSMKLYQERYPDIASRIRYIRNIFDDQVFYPLSLLEREQARQSFARQLQLADDTQFILFAGRLQPQKDPLLLIDSIAALNQPNVHLLVVGDGDLMKQVQSRIAEQNLAQQVTLLGALEQRKLADLHRLASVCVLTSIYEGLPVVALESLACGTPLVTTRCGETPNLLTVDSGIICEERSPEVIAQALRQVLNHPDHYTACVEVVQPYSARHVVHSTYASMLHRWEQRTSASAVA